MAPPPLPTTTQKEVVGGRLSAFWQVWQKKGADKWVVEVLRWGYQPKFKTRPTLSRESFMETHYRDPEKQSLIRQEVNTMLTKQAIEEVKGDIGLGYYSRLFLVAKKNGKLRPVINLKKLNKFLDIPRFHMETIQTVWETLSPGNYTFSLDLQDAYFHVPIHVNFRKYLRFAFEGKIYQFRALPFGLSTSPWAFTRVVSEVKKMVHLLNIMLNLYLDDWLVQVVSYQLGLEQAQMMLDLCRELGLLVNLEKSELTPSQDFVFIGARFNLVRALVFPSEANATKVAKLVWLFRTSKAQTARKWQSLLGTLGSQDRFIRYARFHMRPIQWHLALVWNQTTDSRDKLLEVPDYIKEHLKWWQVPHRLSQGVPLLPPQFDLKMFTDASTSGWGGQVEDQLYQGTWSHQEKNLHINVLEMRAIYMTLTQCSPPPQSQILVATDNKTVLAYVNKEGGTRSWFLMKETFSLFRLLIANNWTLKARYIPGSLNVIADQLSRQGQILPTEWSLHHQVVKDLFSRWGTPQVDLFATRYNRKCECFVSPAPDPLAWEVDALTLDLEGLVAYAYPPQQILLKFLQRFQLARRCRVILVAPFWPKQPWFPLLSQLTVDGPIPLPSWPNLLKQPLSNRFNHRVETLKLHAWLLER